MLITCDECQNEISDEAQTCPKCGATVKSAKASIRADNKETIVIGIAVLVIAGGAYLYAGARQDAAFEQTYNSCMTKAKGIKNASNVCRCILSLGKEADNILSHLPIVGSYFAPSGAELKELDRKAVKYCVSKKH